jgi:HEAT repeat protein
MKAAKPMQQDSGLAQRGLILLGVMLILVTAVGLVLFRPRAAAPSDDPVPANLAAFAVLSPGGTFPGSLNWAALGILGKNSPSSSGWLVRYNATLALAKRGSAQLPLDVLCEMLNEDQQMRNFRFVQEGGKESINEQGARNLVLNALDGFVLWHQNQKASQVVDEDSPNMQKVYAAIDALTHSESQVVRDRAAAVLKKRRSGDWK